MEESVKVDKRIRSVKSRKGSQEFVNLGLTTTASASVDVVDGGTVTFTITAEHDNDLRIFATEHVSIYESSVSTANKIPSGGNLDNNDYEVAFWYDWGATDDNNVVFIAWVHNRTGSTQTILARANARFVIETAGLGAA